MIMEIYAVKDKQVNAFLQPFFSPTIGSALRSLGSVLNDPNHEFSKHVADYTLYKLGEFDDLTGVISAYSEPDLITALERLKTTT